MEAITAIDVLRRGGLNVESISIEKGGIVVGAHGIQLLCDKNFAEADFCNASMLLLPGGMPGAATLDKHLGLRQLILYFAANNKPIAAICAAPMVLGNLGLLKGKPATCYPGFEKHLEGAQCTTQQVVKADNIITGRGPGAAIEFALAIVQLLVSKEKAEELVEAMCIVR
jgi:4-methyl-5(b-hydroxyethyl)-thiazole monophosphate biosynthesis